MFRQKKQLFKTVQKFNHFTNSNKNLNIIDWQSKIVSLAFSSQGSSGVIFVQVKNGALVFKPTDQVSLDCFLNQFGKILEINVPQIKIITYDSVDFKMMMKGIQKYCYEDQPLYRKIKAKLNRPFYQLLQYIPSLPLTSIGPNRFKQIFSEKQNLLQIGRIIAHDIILNNSDRFYFFWDTQGNAGNLLFEIQRTKNVSQEYLLKQRNGIDGIKFKKIITIDTRPTIMNSENKYSTPHYDILIERIKDFLKRLFQFLDHLEAEKQKQDKIQQIQVINEFKNLNRQFLFYTQRMFTLDQLEIISKGIVLTLDKFIKLGWTFVQQLIKSLKKSQDDDYDQINYFWNNALSKLHQNYFVGILKSLELIWIVYKSSIDKILIQQIDKIKILQEQQKQLYNIQNLQQNQKIQNQQKIAENQQQKLNQIINPIQKNKSNQDQQIPQQIKSKMQDSQQIKSKIQQNIAKSQNEENKSELIPNSNLTKSMNKQGNNNINILQNSSKVQKKQRKSMNAIINRQRIQQKLVEFKSRNG